MDIIFSHIDRYWVNLFKLEEEMISLGSPSLMITIGAGIFIAKWYGYETQCHLTVLLSDGSSSRPQLSKDPVDH